MAERSKAPDSRVKPLSLTGVFWSTYVGVGSNPTVVWWNNNKTYKLYEEEHILVFKDVTLFMSKTRMSSSTPCMLVCRMDDRDDAHD